MEPFKFGLGVLGLGLYKISGSSNIEAGPLLAVMTGHLSHQIEHHLFPEIPCWRYPQMSPEGHGIA